MKRRTNAAAESAGGRPENQSATLAAVAAKAGVSPSTVSRILNGTAKVSSDKRQVVERVIAELGFRPNPLARSLAGGRSNSIGVVTQAIDSPFYGEALRGIEDKLGPAGIIPIYVSGHWLAAGEQKALDLLLSRRVDGVIMFAGKMANSALQRVAKQVPLVLTGRQMSGPRLATLNFDNLTGAKLATQHLIALGHRRIVHIAGDLDHGDAVERLEGYRAALVEAGLTPDPAMVFQGDFREVSGVRVVNQLLEQRMDFSSIFAANDQMALGALLGLYRKGIRVPDDVSLVGFDDVQGASYSMPPLTTVRQPMYELGALAADAMLALLRGQRPQVELPAPQLMTRESTRRLRA